jgi:hypothetical protein
MQVANVEQRESLQASLFLTVQPLNHGRFMVVEPLVRYLRIPKLHTLRESGRSHIFFYDLNLKACDTNSARPYFFGGGWMY